MTIKTNITNRRELASALAQYMNTRAVYLGPPTFAYQIGDIHLSREGILSGDDLDGIFPFLEMQGIITAQPKMIRAAARHLILCHVGTISDVLHIHVLLVDWSFVRIHHSAGRISQADLGRVYSG